MNVYIFSAGIVATFATIGHFTYGRKMFLKPMLRAEFDPVAKRTMQIVFHYVSAFLIFSAYILLMTGFMGIACQFDPQMLHGFLLVVYLLMSITGKIMAWTSKIKGGLFKMFQWIIWFVIAFLIAAGMCPHLNGVSSAL